MDQCPLYSDPQLYDLLFPSAAGSSVVPDEARRRRILASEAFYLSEAEKGDGDVLEIACGSGRLAIALAKHGFEVTGLDLSAPMIDLAKEKARQANAQLRLFQADMRCFTLAKRFSTIFLAGNSLLHLVHVEDLLQCLWNAGRHLSPGGRFVFDISNPEVQALAGAMNEPARVFQVNDPVLGSISIEENSEYDAATQVRHIAWRFSTVNAAKYRVFEYQLRVIFPQELLLLLEATGWRLKTRFGEFTREEFSSRSPRQVCICSAK